MRWWYWCRQHHHTAFENIEFVIGIRMKMHGAAARDFDVIHARIGGGVEWPQAHGGGAVGGAIAEHVVPTDDEGGSIAFLRMPGPGGILSA